MIKLPKKKYTPKQDVQLGKEAASEVRKQYPSSRTLIGIRAVAHSGNGMSSIVGYRTLLAEEGPSFVWPRTSECAKTHAAVNSITVNAR